MTLFELLNCSADTKMILKNNRNRLLEEEEITKLHFHTRQMIQKEKDKIQSIDEIYMFLCMTFNLWEQKEYLVPEETIYLIFDRAAERINELDLSQLGKLSVISHLIYEKVFETFKRALVKEFVKYTEFQGLSFNSLMWVWRGMITKYVEWPHNMQVFLKAAYLHLQSVSASTSKFSYLAIMSEGIKESDYPIKELIVSKLKYFIERDSKYFMIPEKQSVAYFMFQVLNSIDDLDEATEICVKLANRFFVTHFIKNSKMRMAKINKKRIFRTYLLLLEQARIAHPVYFDIIVSNLDLIFTDMRSKLIVTYLMPSFYCLVFLNYADSFQSKYACRRMRSAWESVIKKMSTAIVSGEFSYFFDVDEDVEFQKHNRKIILLNYLWSLAYLNVYNPEEISILVESERFNNIKPEDLYDFIKLFHVNSWLESRNINGPMIKGVNRTKMDIFKKIFDSSDAKSSNTALHTKIREKIADDALNFTENYKNFPFFFDFANPTQKIGIIIDRDSTLVKIGSELDLNAVQKMSDKLARASGWIIKRLISYKDSKPETLKLDPSLFN